MHAVHSPGFVLRPREREGELTAARMQTSSASILVLLHEEGDPRTRERRTQMDEGRDAELDHIQVDHERRGDYAPGRHPSQK